MACICPASENIVDLANQICPFNWRQTSGIAFGVQGNPFTTGVAPATDIEDITSWTTRLAAVDDTKVQVLQKVSSFLIPASESINLAPDTNDTPEGVQFEIDETTQVATFTILDPPMDLINNLKQQVCTTTTMGIVGVMLFSSTQILSNNLDFIPINNMFVSSPALGGKTTPNSISISFNLDKEWYSNLIATTASGFNPLSLTN